MDLAALIIEGLFGLVLMFFGFVLKGLRDDVKQCNESITSLATRQADGDIEAVKSYATKEEHQALRERVHDLSENVTMLRTLANMKRGS